MIIREAQMQAFQQAAVKGSEDRLVLHVNKFFPKETQALGENGTREAVRQGMKRAGAYGIVSERGVCKFIDVMFAFGQGFDTDPRWPWAAAILNDSATIDPKVRVDQLVAAARQHRQGGVRG